MARLRSRVLSAMTVFVCATAPASFSEQPPAPADASTLRIDVAVADRQGQWPAGFDVSGIEVIEGASPMSVLAAEARTTPRFTADKVVPIESDEDERRAARTGGVRLFAFYLDEYHVTPGAGAARARRVVSEFVADKVHARDLAVVMRPLQSARVLRFSRDRARLNGAIAGFTGRKEDFTPVTPFEAQQIGRDPAVAAAVRRRIVAEDLRELTMRLRALGPDRAILVIVSEGFGGAGRAIEPTDADLEAAARAAGDAHVAIYTFNPTRLDETADAARDRSAALAMRRWLAEQGGGLAIEADNEIAGFARIAHDTEAYAALTVRTARATAGFHPIVVRSRRGEITLRSRAGYWSTSSDEWRRLEEQPPASRPPARRPERRSPLVETWTGVVDEASGRARVAVTWEPREGAAERPDLAIVQARTVAGEIVFDGRIARAGSVDGRVGAAAFTAVAGRLEIDLTLIDAQGRVLDIDARDYHVPDLGMGERYAASGPVLLPLQILLQPPGDSASPCSAVSEAPLARRRFARRERLCVRVTTAGRREAPVAVAASILTGAGRRLRPIEPVDAGERGDIFEFVLPLALLPPGEYQIEVTASSADGRVVEHLAFRVTS